MCRSSRIASTTFTSRTPRECSTGAVRSSAPTSTSGSRIGAGCSYRPVTATSTSSPCSGPSTGLVTKARSRSIGRTRPWPPPAPRRMPAHGGADGSQAVDHGGPNNLDAATTNAAADAGKHVICEKPLGRTADESYDIWQRVDKTGVKHMCAFNYRFVPAVRLAREMLEAGELGEIYHFRARYLQEWIVDPQFPMALRFDRNAAGSVALGDLGAHVIDLGRYLVGDISAVSGATRTFIKKRPGGTVDVDDAFESVVEFKGGAVGTIEASRFCLGRENGLTFEING